LRHPGHSGDNSDEFSKADKRDTQTRERWVILRLLLAWCAASMISAPALGAVLANLQQPRPQPMQIRPIRPQLAAR
jgi:hypothetical protein